ncbi:hypothetical protein HOLleu_26686 [Holothuria leucospilota]|uniref:Uncharacterized protein n=1 Tax=Holothuria leucospilota TaxID=206669 RepID=A0A9Q1H087_HOLLE|nr:hypothetical protein HOLleu_26686 [Holothuria leucospilota]
MFSSLFKKGYHRNNKKSSNVRYVERSNGESEITDAEDRQDSDNEYNYSEWAAPIDKPDGCYRIFGDYKVKVNVVLKTKENPLPTQQELLMKLNGGQKFTKLDTRISK